MDSVHTSLLDDLYAIDSRPTKTPTPPRQESRTRCNSSRSSMASGRPPCSYDESLTPSSTTTNCSDLTSVSIPTVGAPGPLEPVTAANVIQSIRIVEARVLEIALVVSNMDVDVGHIERAMVQRILNSVVTGGKT